MTACQQAAAFVLEVEKLSVEISLRMKNIYLIYKYLRKLYSDRHWQFVTYAMTSIIQSRFFSLILCIFLILFNLKRSYRQSSLEQTWVKCLTNSIWRILGWARCSQTCSAAPSVTERRADIEFLLLSARLATSSEASDVSPAQLNSVESRRRTKMSVVLIWLGGWKHAAPCWSTRNWRLDEPAGCWRKRDV